MKKFLNPTRISGLVVSVLSAAALIMARGFDSSSMMTNDILGPAAWPSFLSAGMLILGLILVVFGDKTTKGSDTEENDSPSETHPKQLIVTVLAMVAYVALFEVLGFLLVTPVFIFGMTLYYGGKLRLAAVYAVVFTVILYFLFKVMLGILLPPIPFI